MHDPLDANPMRRLGIDDDLDLRGRDVADLAVQRQVHRRLLADVVDELILARVPGEFQPAADHPFVEPFEPAQPAAAFQAA